MAIYICVNIGITGAIWGYNTAIMLSWDDTYALALKLIEKHPAVAPEQVSLSMVHNWVLELDDFQDDPQTVNDAILMAIIQEWFEEANPL